MQIHGKNSFSVSEFQEQLYRKKLFLKSMKIVLLRFALFQLFKVVEKVQWYT